jgi:hypothetical protein
MPGFNPNELDQPTGFSSTELDNNQPGFSPDQLDGFSPIQLDKPKGSSIPSKVTRFFMRNAPFEQFKTSLYNREQMPQPLPEESLQQFSKRADEARGLPQREEEIASEGTVPQFGNLMTASIATGLAAAPVATAKMVGLFATQEIVADVTKLNKAIQSIPEPNIRDVVDMAKFGLEGVVASNISGVTDLFFKREKIKKAAYTHVDKGIEMQQISPEEKIQAKKEAHSAVDAWLKGVWTAGKKQKTSIEKTKQIQSDFTDIHKGYIVKNEISPEGKITETKMNTAPKGLIKYNKQAEDILYNALLTLQGSQKREIPMPDTARSHFKRQIAFRLANGESPIEITQNLVSGKLREPNTVLITEATPDFSDPNFSVYDLQQLRLVPLSVYSAEKFKEGLKPSDIKIRQQVRPGRKPYTADLRSNMMMTYKSGLKQGSWGVLPETSEGVPVAPVTPSLGEQVMSGTLPPETAQQIVEGQPIVFKNVLIEGKPVQEGITPEQGGVDLSSTEKAKIDGMIKAGASREEIHQEILKDTGTAKEEFFAKGGQVSNPPSTAPVGVKPGTAEYFQQFPEHKLTTFEEQKGWPQREGEMVEPPSQSWYTGDPHEGLIRFFYNEIDKAYKTLPEIPINPDSTEQIYFGTDYAKAKADYLKATALYNKMYPDVKETADHLNRLINDLRNRREYTQKVDEAQSGVSEEVKQAFEDEMKRAEQPTGEKGEPTPAVEGLIEAKARGTSANAEDLKLLSDELRDWNELLSPYIPVRAYAQERNLKARIIQSKEGFAKQMEAAKLTPEYKAVNEMFIKRIEELIKRMDPEQLAILNKRIGFDLTKLKEKVPEFIKNQDTIQSMVSVRLAELQAEAEPWAAKELAGSLKLTTQDTLNLPVYKGLNLKANEQILQLEPGTYDLRDVNGKLTINYQGEDFTVDENKWGNILGNPNVDITNNGLEMQCAFGPPLSDYGRRLYNKLTPWGKFFKRGVGKRPVQMRVLLEIMRVLRLNPEAKAWVLDKFARGGNVEEMLKRKPSFGPAAERTKQLFFQDKITQPALNTFNEQFQRHIYNNFNEIAKETAGAKGIKGPAYSQFEKFLRSLLEDASEQVAANEDYPDTGKWAFTDSTTSKHLNKEGILDPAQAKYYHDRIVYLRQGLGLPIDPVQDAKWADPSGNREPIFWDMLEEVTGNKKLQDWLLWYKANESILLNEQLARGVFDKTDIYESQKYGYTKRVYTETPTQQWFGKTKSQKSSAETTRRPHAETRNFQEFYFRGKELGYIPVDDFFASTFDYTRESLYAIHQADTLARVLTHNAPLVHHNTAFRAVSKDPMVGSIITHKNADIVLHEATKLSKALGHTVEPDAVLESWGFLKGREMEGFVDWYKGAWQAPYVYRPVADLFHVMFQASNRGLGYGRALDVVTNAVDGIKFIRTSNPVDTPLIYAAGAYTIRPWRIVNIIPKLIVTPIKGAIQGFEMFKGKHTYGLSPEDFPNLDKMIKYGTTGVTFSGSFQSMWDRARLDHIPELNNVWDNTKEYVLSFGGINKALFEDWIGKEIAGAWEYKYRGYLKQGMTEETAARRSSAFLNQISALLNRGIYGNEAPLLRLGLVSRNLTIAALRNIALLAYAPFKGPLDYSGLYKYHTGEVSRLFNAVLTTEMSPEDRAVISLEVWKTLAKLAAAKLILGGMFQYANSFKDDDEWDEHGEKGNDPSTWKNGEYPKKRDILENPDTAFMKVRTGDKDAYNKPAYADVSGFRSINDMQDILLGSTGQGRGVGRWLSGKQNFWLSTLENIASNKDIDYGQVYDPRAEGWTQFQQKLGYWLQEQAPIGWTPQVSMQDPELNMLYRWYNRLGGQTSFGHPTTGMWTPEEWKTKEKAASEEQFIKSQEQAKMRFVPPGKEMEQEVTSPTTGLDEYTQRNYPELYFQQQHQMDVLRNFFRKEKK